MQNKKTINLAIGILLVIALVSGGMLGHYYYSLARAAGEFDDLAQTLHHEQGQKPEQKPGLDRLHAQNKDLAGWLTIAGTAIDYPVMFTPEEPEYYLHKNFDKEYSASGTLFIDGRCSLHPRADNIIIHGHNMKNGSMFASLFLYEKKEFWQQHPRLEFYTLNEKQIYDLIAVFPTEVYNDELEFKYHTLINAADKNDFDNYIAGAKKASLYETNQTAQYGDYLLTLSTCAYHTANGRFVILARFKG